jgi:anti-sigma B factor antagonist
MFSTNLSTRSYEGHAVVELRGELDLADAVFVAAVLTAAATPGPGIIVDLAGLEFIDSSGVAALARGRRRATQAGGYLVLAAPQRQVRRVIAIPRLTEAFSVYATVEEAAGATGHLKEPGHLKESGQLKERVGPAPQRPRRAHWPSAVTWSRTRGLLPPHSSRPSLALPPPPETQSS